jgi:ArsR family transcriptional regulator
MDHKESRPINMEPVTTAEPRIDPHVIERAARVIRVLGHPLRLRILELLETGERNVADLQEELDASQAVISQQLAILRAEDVVAPRRDGPRVFYRITEPKVAHILDCIRQCDLPERTDLMALPGLAIVAAGLSGGPGEGVERPEPERGEPADRATRPRRP